jgi:hypothetical protein
MFIPLKVIILSVLLEIPLSVLGVGRQTQPITKLLLLKINDSLHIKYNARFCMYYQIL